MKGILFFIILGLEQLLLDAKKKVTEQQDLAQVLVGARDDFNLCLLLNPKSLFVCMENALDI